jgi:hypothetical protein
MIRGLLSFVVLLSLTSMATAAAPVPNKAAVGEPRKISKGGFSFSIEPSPSWVVPAIESSSASIDRSPMHYRIIDGQTRLQENSRWSHTHLVRVRQQNFF